jgi:mannobiose 2-epimerase
VRARLDAITLAVARRALAEALDAFERSGDDEFLRAAAAVWRFIRVELVDRDLGEWKSSPCGSTTFPEYNVKIGAMKGPYHNGRACMEIVARTEWLLAAGGPQVPQNVR